MSAPLSIQPRKDTVEGHPILRPLPSAKCRSIGPFVFFDHMLEHDYVPGSGMSIDQHPHIGLSTLTYLFEGNLQHKDSLGSDQIVSPGDVSWMTAGKAVAHVERTPETLKQSGGKLHGLQVWLALPASEELCDPSYTHYPAASLPVSDGLGVRICLIAGTGFCMESPVNVRSATLYADIQMQAGSTLAIPDEHPERAIYLLSGEALLDDTPIAAQQLVVLPAGQLMTVTACSECHWVIIGGTPVGARRINWNFVASDAALIDQARARWANEDWPSVPGETRRIALPR
ncbi:MAG: pirin family protein [Pseudomonas marincola]|jgi:redox-sensitive bicupin YhaK (pirin superfamily)|uniref:pirin family protein n=1 Tax=Pseudomonas marincola TaxID=437900 RepID=UPI003001D288